MSTEARATAPALLPWLAAPLQQLLATARGHALLLHGAPGDGAWEAATAVAQAWLCEGEGKGVARPCGRCPACHLFQGHSHPDQHWLLPQDLAIERGYPVELKEGRKPSRQIRVDDVREAIGALTTTSGRGRGQVLLILPADTMNAVAASALLKTLEEPARGTRIVLATAEPARLLPTILSRCQIWRLPRASRAQAEAWLREQGLEQPAVLLAASGGRPLDALALHRGGVSAAQWQALPQRLARGEVAALSGLGVPAMLDTLAKLAHDAMAAAVGAPARFFVGADWPSTPDLARVMRWQRRLAEQLRHADHPWNEPLLADALASEARDALRGPPR